MHTERGDGGIRTGSAFKLCFDDITKSFTFRQNKPVEILSDSATRKCLRRVLMLAGVAAVTPAYATNYLVFLLDDMGADKVSGYADIMYPGYTPTYLPATPAMDTLADVGLRFSRAYASPVCSPSRAALLTGMHPFETDVGNILSTVTPAPELPTDLTTIPEMLTESTPDAAASGLFGKWHLGMTTPGGSLWTSTGERTEAPGPGIHGFSAYDGNLDGQVQGFYNWLETRWPVTFASGSTGALNQMQSAWASDPPITDAVDWIASQSGGWFALVSLNAPHVDADFGGGGWELDDLAPEDLGTCVEMDGDATCANQEIFATLVEDVDARLEELLLSLEAEDPAFLADTVIILVGDNGSQPNVIEAPWTVGGERMMAGKFSLYESGIRVPLIVTRGCDWMDQADGSFDGLIDGVDAACADTTVPMVAPGLTITAPVQVQDIYATIAELAGSTDPVPASSVSLVPCLSATEATAGDCGAGDLMGRGVYAEMYSRPYSAESGYGTTGPADNGNAAVIQGNYKIIASVSVNPTARCVQYQFYDLGSDPYETNDLRRGGGTLTAAQSAGYLSAWLVLRETIAPDWFVSMNCSSDSAWDLDHDFYEDVAHGGVDCNDSDATIKPGVVDAWYDGVDKNCDGLDDYDQDGDGSRAASGGGADCDDTSAAIAPTVAEVCNGVDENCSGVIDEGVTVTGYLDLDGDTFGDVGAAVIACALPDGYVADATDCDDSLWTVRPDAAESCNGVDDNCAGGVDEGVTLVSYRDADGDGYGKVDLSATGCSVPAGYTLTGGDCNDSRNAIHPGAVDYWYDGKDTDCAGNDDFDRDGDGYAAWYFGGTDCDDGKAVVHPGAAEIRQDWRDSNCNGRDND